MHGTPNNRVDLTTKKHKTLSLNRRLLLQSMGALLGYTFLSNTAYARNGVVFTGANFMVLSSALTGHTHLNEVTANRIFAALRDDDPAFVGHYEKIHQLNNYSQSIENNMPIFATNGLKETVLKIIAAWYTGTIDTKSGPVVVAYKDALMYRPVADGLVVPTYASKGPLYWKDTLPPGVTHVPHTHFAIL